MSYPSTHSLLRNIAKSIITARDETVEQHYFKGWNVGIGTSFTTLGTITFDSIVLPSSNQALQITSSSISDVGLVVLVTGYDSDFNEIQETVITAGQSPVALTNSYFRIKQMRIVSDNSNAGDLYLSTSGAVVLLGVPTLGSTYIYSMYAGERVGTILNGTIPPSENGYLVPNYVVFSVANGTNITSEYQFQLKKTNQTQWYTEFNFYIDERSNTQFMWRLDGVEAIINDDIATPIGYDVRIIAKRSGSGTLNASASLSIRQIAVD